MKGSAEMTPTNPQPRYAHDEDQAIQRAQKFQAVDPFPEIEPALLNSADICDYVAATGMIHPFYEREELLKPASYEVALRGKFVRWDDLGNKQVGNIEPGDEFTLRRNSIAFVTVEPTFRLPQYVALRFNLKITHIHRGILLGTGPLVDPGFTGKLLIPLHNLTTNDYILVGGESLIWIEFTKLSSRPEWRVANEIRKTVSRRKVFYDFPKKKKDVTDVEEYLRKADPHRPIRSSIPDVLERALAQAQQARAQAEHAGTRVRHFTFGGLLAIAAILLSVVFGALQIAGLFNTANAHLRDSQNELQIVRSRLNDELKRSIILQKDLEALTVRVKSLEDKNSKR
jgi:deoxycytidine triphosphate deaminase